MPQSLRLLFLSTPVGPLGSGLGGGVELTLVNVAQELQRRGHQVQVVAPQESYLPGISLQTVGGSLQPTAIQQGRDAPIVLSPDSALAVMWDYARQVQSDYDLLVNMAYDWLPFYLTPFFQTPIAHFVSMGSLTDAMDQIITKTGQRFPGTLGAYTQSQAATFPDDALFRCLGSAVDLARYQFGEAPGPALAWLGRISPEKGLEDAVAAVQQTRTPLRVLGKLEYPDYWQAILTQYPDAPVEYGGFLPTDELQAVVRQCRGVLMTPRWIEAFGNVAIEALACGTPVIAYRRGGPAEIVRHGETGWLVEPDDVTGLATAIQQLDQIDRHACRQQAEEEFSLTALGERFESWFRDML